MARFFRTGDNTFEIDTEALDEEKLNAVKSAIRLEILEILAENPSYPARVSKQLGIGKQKAYYHFEKLKEAELIEEQRKEKHSGGLATFYRPSAGAYHIDLGGEGRKTFIPGKNRALSRFLYPLVSKGRINGKIVVGSSERHGPDQVRARDGHLAGEIAGKLGNRGELCGEATMLDTDLSRDGDYGRNLLILGGVLTNTAAKHFNGDFPVSFSGEEFPYREIKTPETTYDEGDIGVVSKTVNPEDPEKAVYLVAGVRAEGTRAAVTAFRNLEELVGNYKGGEFYRVVRGLDMDGDGLIDDFEVVE